MPSLGGAGVLNCPSPRAGVWVLGLPLGLGGLLVWLLLVLRRRLGLWALFQLWWLVVVGPGRGGPCSGLVSSCGTTAGVVLSV